MVIRIAGERMYLWRAADYFAKARICLADPRQTADYGTGPAVASITADQAGSHHHSGPLHRYNYPIAATRLDPTTRPERATLVVRRIQIVHHKPRRPWAHQPRRSVLVFPAKAGIHARHGHRTEPVLGPANGRDPWAGVTGYLRLFGMRLQSAG